jgi:uncharacterized protein YkwD
MRIIWLKFFTASLVYTMMLTPVSASPATDAIKLINKARASQNLGRLSTSSPLNKAAMAHAKELESRGYGLRSRFKSHYSLDGSNPRQRLAKVGVKSCVTVENLAWGQKSAEEVVSNWLASKEHRYNAFYPDVTRIGLAVSDRTWVMVASMPCKRSLRSLFKAKS